MVEAALYTKFGEMWGKAHTECGAWADRTIATLGSDPHPWDVTLIKFRAALTTAAVLYTPALKIALSGESDYSALRFDGRGRDQLNSNEQNPRNVFELAAERFAKLFAMPRGNEVEEKARELAQYHHVLDNFILGPLNRLYRFVRETEVIQKYGPKYDVVFPADAQPLKYIAEEVIGVAEKFADARGFDLICPPLLSNVNDLPSKTWMPLPIMRDFEEGRYFWVAQNVLRDGLNDETRNVITGIHANGILSRPGYPFPKGAFVGDRPLLLVKYSPSQWNDAHNPDSPQGRVYKQEALARLTR